MKLNALLQLLHKLKNEQGGEVKVALAYPNPDNLNESMADENIGGYFLEEDTYVLMGQAYYDWAAARATPPAKEESNAVDG